MYKIQKTHEFTTNNYKKIVNLTNYCGKHLEDSEWEMVVLSMLPPVYKFKFHCAKQKFWAILTS